MQNTYIFALENKFSVYMFFIENCIADLKKTKNCALLNPNCYNIMNHNQGTYICNKFKTNLKQYVQKLPTQLGEIYYAIQHIQGRT